MDQEGQKEGSQKVRLDTHESSPGYNPGDWNHEKEESDASVCLICDKSKQVQCSDWWQPESILAVRQEPSSSSNIIHGPICSRPSIPYLLFSAAMEFKVLEG